MSEFKFTCPVCGQHIAADSTTSGAQIECPTCFQRIIIPQAPRSDSRYILSATQYIKPQALTPPQPVAPPPPTPRPSRVTTVLVWLLVGVVLGTVIFVLLARRQSKDGARTTSPVEAADQAPAGSTWTLDLAGRSVPADNVSGRVHDRTFVCDRAFLQNGSLALRKGRGAQPELVVNVYLAASAVQELDRKRFDIGTNSSGTMPRVVLRWREGDLRVAQTFSNGYAMRLEFGPVASNAVPGKIYLCTPDVTRSFVAGSFVAEITNVTFPRPR